MRATVAAVLGSVVMTRTLARALARDVARRVGGLLLLLGGLVHTALVPAADTQAWFTNGAKITLAGKWALKITQEARTQRKDYDDTFLRNASIGLFRDLPVGFYIGTSYKREEADLASLDIAENRYTLEGGWKRAFRPALTLDTRFRVEDRNFDDSRLNDFTRLRLRVRLRTRVSPGKLKLKPFVSLEAFSDRTDRDRIERVRYHVGTAFVVGKHVELHVGYLRQERFNRPDVNAFNAGIELIF